MSSLGDQDSNGRGSVTPLWLYLAVIAGLLVWIEQVDPVTHPCRLLDSSGTACALLDGPAAARAALDSVVENRVELDALRQSLGIDLLLIAFYTVFLLEASAWGRNGFRLPVLRDLGDLLRLLVPTAAVLDLLENLCIASYAGGVLGWNPPGAWEPTAASYLASLKWVLLAIAGLYAALVLLRWTGRIALGWAAGPQADEPTPEPDPQELHPIPPEEVEDLDEVLRIQREYTNPNGVLWDGAGYIGVGLSGGGIRSAAFNLGVLQALDTDERSWLRRVRYLATVSGGGYIGSALQLLARNAFREGMDPSTLDPRPYASDAPETARLRRHHRYLSTTAVERLRMALVLGSGIAFNVLALATALFALALPARWLLGDDEVRAQLMGLPWPLAAAAIIGALAAAVVVPFERAALRRWLVWGLGSVGGLLWLPRWPTAWLWPGTWSPRAERLAVLVVLLALVWRRASRLRVYQRTVARVSLRAFGDWRRRLVRMIPGALLALVAYTALVAATAIPIRLQVAVVVLGLLLWVFVDQRVWSPHRFYKRRLASAFAIRRTPEGRAESISYYETLTKLETWAVRQKGFPQLIVCAAANLSNFDLPPTGIPAVPFTFEHDYVGSPDLGWLRTGTMERILGTRNREDTTLQAATAVSGAAIASAMGSARLSTSYAWIAVLNARLGVWLPNPRAVTKWARMSLRKRRWHRIRRATYLIREVFGSYPKDLPYVYVSDGGHVDNLGFLELLRRRCGTILLVNASGDPLGTTETLLGTIDLACSYLRVGVTLEPHTKPVQEADPETRRCALNTLVRKVPGGSTPSLRALASQQRLVENQIVTGTISYPAVGDLPAFKGRLVVAKAVLTTSTPAAILDWAASRARGARKFPKTSTTNQWLTDSLFERYVELGRFLGQQAIAHVDASAPSVKGGGTA